MGKLAKDLRIGDVLGTNKQGDAIRVKVLHELCSQKPTPHVHVVSSQGHQCLGFNRFVA